MFSQYRIKLSLS